MPRDPLSVLAYAEVEGRQYDRLAAIQRHFNQQVTSRGNPDADHAVAFVETVADPEGQLAPVAVEAPVGELVEIDYNGIKRQVRALIPAVALLLSPRTMSPETAGPDARRSPVTPSLHGGQESRRWAETGTRMNRRPRHLSRLRR
jgi:hypothetical protein